MSSCLSTCQSLVEVMNPSVKYFTVRIINYHSFLYHPLVVTITWSCQGEVLDLIISSATGLSTLLQLKYLSEELYFLDSVAIVIQS